MKKISFAILLVLLVSCTGWKPEGEEHLVVEGWISEGQYPVVMLTTSVPVSTDYQSIDSQRHHLVRWGKVTVSDGEKSVILTGMRDSRYFPPYIYTCTGTSTLRGEAGRKYEIKVEYSGETVEGYTYVTAPVPLDSLWCEASADNDGRYEIKARFDDPSGEENYYRVFVKVEGRDSTFVPGYMGCLSDEGMDGTAEISIMRGMSIENESSWEWNPALFEKGETVHVRFCTMDRASYEFWDSYARVASLSIIPFFPATYNPSSNLSSGIGYWCGYGEKNYSIKVE